MGKIVNKDGTVLYSNPLDGASWAQLGDSLTYFFFGTNPYSDNGFGSKIIREFGISKFLTYNKAGNPGKSTYGTVNSGTSLTDSQNAVEAVDALVAQGITYDYVTFAYGTNDDYSRLGTLTYQNQPNMYTTDAIEYIVNTMRESFPATKVAWIVPPVTDWTNTAWSSMGDYSNRQMNLKVDMMIQKLEALNVPYCDMYHNSGITASMLNDGVHFGTGDYDYDSVACNLYYKTLRQFLINLANGYIFISNNGVGITGAANTELVDLFTIDADVVYVRKDTDMNGNLYEYDELMVCIELATGTQNSRVIVSTYNNKDSRNNNTLIGYCYVDNAVQTRLRYLNCLFEKKFDIVTSTFMISNYSYAGASTSGVATGNIALTDKKMRCLVIECATGDKLLKAGTVVKIYGRKLS